MHRCFVYMNITWTALAKSTSRWQQREQTRVQYFAQGYFELCSGRAGDQTINPVMNGRPPLPPVLLLPHICTIGFCVGLCDYLLGKDEKGIHLNVCISCV